MPDVVGYRAKMGVVVPSTNTVVEYDYSTMRVPGVSFHCGRGYFVPPEKLDSPEAFQELLDAIDAGAVIGIRDVLTVEPDYMIMGMSGETFWGGKAGNEAFEERMRGFSKGPISTGATACRRALEALGARRIGFVSPYPPIGNEQVSKFFTDHGYDVVRDRPLSCESPHHMAQVSEATLAKVILELDSPDIDALLQVGTNLSMVRLADAATRTLGKPVIAINAATVWDAYRQNGIEDRFAGFGPLLERH